MKDKLKKLEELAQSDHAQELFSGSIEDIQKKLSIEGIDLSKDELKAFINGILDTDSDELNESDLATVAGGKTYPGYERDCYNAGRKIAKVCKWAFGFFSKFAS